MAETFGIGLVVGASLAASVTSTFTNLDSKVKQTTVNVQDLTKKSIAFQEALKLKNSVFELQNKYSAGGGQDKILFETLQKTKSAYYEASVNAKKYGADMRNIARDSLVASNSLENYNKKLEYQNAQAEQAQKRSQIKNKLLSTVGLVATVALPIKSAIDFESSMADVKKVINFTADGFVEFSNEILNLSQKIPLTTSGLAEIAAAAGQAGIATEELLQFTEDAAIMGVAFGISAETAGSAMTGLRTNFKLSQDQVISLGDSFNILSNNMDAQAADLISFTNRVGGTASIYKFTGQEMGALGASFAALKVNTEEASTATNALLVRLGTADKLGKDAELAFNSIGLSGETMAKAFREDAQGALLMFLKAAKESDDPMRALNAILGANHAPKIAKLVSGLDEYHKALALVADETNYAGSMQKEYGARADTIQNSLVLFANAINVVAVNMANVLLPTIKNVVNAIIPFISQFAGLIVAFPKVTTAIAGLVVGFVAFRVVSMLATYSLTIVKSAIISSSYAMSLFTIQNIRAKKASFLLAISTIKSTAIMLAHRAASLALAAGMAVVTSAQWLFNAALTANPIGLVVLGITALAAGMLYLYNTCEPVRAVFDAVFSWIVMPPRDNFVKFLR